MKIQQKKLSEIECNYDVAIIGGGIVGAGTFRDLSLNKVKTLLVDSNDFSSQTSSKSSKMLHGGIRYLENMDFDLVFEALHEKNLWLKIAPHLCYESKFYLPIYKDSLRPKWMIACGLFLYDFLSSFKNSPFYITNKERTLADLPDIKETGLSGAGVYYDAIVDDTRMAIESIMDGLCVNPQCAALNYTKLKEFHVFNNRVEVCLIDTLTNEEKTITAREIIFATGPFTDDILANHKDLKWTPKLLPSKGSHLWLKKDSIKISSPLVLTPNDGRVIFVIPQKEHILVGTTEVEHMGDKFDLEVSSKEIEYLLRNLNEYFPKSLLNEDSIIGSFAGLRPLVKEDETSDRAKTARNHKYYQPRHNVHVMIGGKYTTFRVMAKEVSEVVCKKLGASYNSLLSVGKFKYVSPLNTFNEDSITKEAISLISQNELIRGDSDLQRRYKIPRS